jgi:hypothetical protein
LYSIHAHIDHPSPLKFTSFRLTIPFMLVS